jgi:FHA domain-containing protein
VARLSDIGKEWQSRLKGFFESPLGPDAHPLEIFQAALDDLERRVQPVGRGGRRFPYNRIVVEVASTHADAATLAVVFRDFDARLRERLAELRCEVPPKLHVAVELPEQPPAEWPVGQLYSLQCHADADADALRVGREEPGDVGSLRVTVVKGASAEPEYTLTDAVVAIGRTAEPADELGRVRRNHVVFVDAVDGVTETVARAHARIQRVGAQYRIYHEGTSNATFIIRGGTPIPVAPRDPRGVRLQSGDEVQLGRALIRVTIES